MGEKHFFSILPFEKSSPLKKHASINPLDALQERHRCIARQAQLLCGVQEKVRHGEKGGGALMNSRGERHRAKSMLTLFFFRSTKNISQPRRPRRRLFLSLSLSLPYLPSGTAPPPTLLLLLRRSLRALREQQQPRSNWFHLLLLLLLLLPPQATKGRATLLPPPLPPPTAPPTKKLLSSRSSSSSPRPASSALSRISSTTATRSSTTGSPYTLPCSAPGCRPGSILRNSRCGRGTTSGCTAPSPRRPRRSRGRFLVSVSARQKKWRSTP